MDFFYISFLVKLDPSRQGRYIKSCDDYFSKLLKISFLSHVGRVVQYLFWQVNYLHFAWLTV